MNDEQPNFKVTDRRLFNADGSPRELPPEEKSERETSASASEREISASAGTGTSTAASSERAPITESQTEQQARQSASAHEADEDELLDAENPAGFINFVMSIASNAASSLGMMEHPVTHKREVDLELAKHWIDILGMLQQKTRGNLLPQEDKILDGLLSDLRMQYVSLANSPSKAAGAYTGRDIVGG
jgi:hypothetical protein